MAKKDQYLVTEATKIGYQQMLGEIEELLTNQLSEPQRIALTDQKTKIREMLEAL